MSGTELRQRLNSMTVEQLQARAYQNSKDHGFWDAQVNVPEKLCLIHSEVSEALEAYRDGHDLKTVSFREDGKPEGFPAELADIAIRLGDLAEGLGIDLESAIRTKMEFNARRPHMHGKVC